MLGWVRNLLFGKVDVAKFSNGEFGRWAEKEAGKYLKRLGYKIVDRNFKTPFGEIDIVIRDGDTIAFVEVKAERGKFGCPEEKVSRVKRQRLIKSAKVFVNRYKFQEYSLRFDVITVKIADRETIIEYAKDAFQVRK